MPLQEQELRVHKMLQQEKTTVNSLLLTAQLPDMITLHHCHNRMPLQEQEPRKGFTCRDVILDAASCSTHDMQRE